MSIKDISKHHLPYELLYDHRCSLAEKENHFATWLVGGVFRGFGVGVMSLPCIVTTQPVTPGFSGPAGGPPLSYLELISRPPHPVICLSCPQGQPGDRRGQYPLPRSDLRKVRRPGTSPSTRPSAPGYFYGDSMRWSGWFWVFFTWI